MTIGWDNPEELLEDEDPDAEPGAPPAGAAPGSPILYSDPYFDPLDGPRARRRRRIEDYLATREYRERGREERRSTRGWR